MGEPGPNRIVDITEGMFPLRVRRAAVFRDSKMDPDAVLIPSNLPSIGSILRRLYVRIERLETDLKNHQKPAGSRTSPARHCRDILRMASVPKRLVSGPYWVDPNLGSRADAVRVECRFEAEGRVAKTCLLPTAPLNEVGRHIYT
ncbi:unnamed protein product [Protopolystoma xenopodis]|uniref:Fibrillar collagen NC1 domain-containing protein n=1 Tax=Protopolystoma xenopodis TaxID=117903 RepID=A0A3S5CDE3_9PLAT|nr:unnamed protein product [Protopolystoma xenopodis]